MMKHLEWIHDMSFDEHFFEDEDHRQDDDTSEQEESEQVGSDDLLADDALRLPESANILVRLHAVRAWLTRRQHEASIAVGDAVLALQEAMQEPEQPSSRLRRRERDGQSGMLRLQHAQRVVLMAQQRLATYEEAQAQFDETVAHVTAGERVLVEYYLALEELLHTAIPAAGADQDEAEKQEVRRTVLADVLHRVEHVGVPDEED
jgi:hypothetical protein